MTDRTLLDDAAPSTSISIDPLNMPVLGPVSVSVELSVTLPAASVSEVMDTEMLSAALESALRSGSVTSM